MASYVLLLVFLNNVYSETTAENTACLKKPDHYN